jgi:hypothetical protein
MLLNPKRGEHPENGRIEPYNVSLVAMVYRTRYPGSDVPEKKGTH